MIDKNMPSEKRILDIGSNSQKEEVDFMSIAVKLQGNDMSFIHGMEKYINSLKNLSTDDAKTKAHEALIRTGVLDESGKPKKNIVSWE